MKNLSPLTILIIGISISMSFLSFGLLHVVLPNRENANNYRQLGDQLQMEADKQPIADQRLKKARELASEAKEQWVRILDRKAPPSSLAAGGINLGVNRWQLTVDVREFLNNFQKALNKQVVQGGVKVHVGPIVARPDQAVRNDGSKILETVFHYGANASPFPFVLAGPTPVVVEGTLEQIYANLAAWSRMPNYIALTQGLKLEGQGSKLKGTYTLVVIGVVRSPVIAPPVPDGGAAGPGAIAGMPGMVAPR